MRCATNVYIVYTCVSKPWWLTLNTKKRNAGSNKSYILSHQSSSVRSHMCGVEVLHVFWQFGPPSLLGGALSATAVWHNEVCQTAGPDQWFRGKTSCAITGCSQILICLATGINASQFSFTKGSPFWPILRGRKGFRLPKSAEPDWGKTDKPK